MSWVFNNIAVMVLAQILYLKACNKVTNWNRSSQLTKLTTNTQTKTCLLITT